MADIIALVGSDSLLGKEIREVFGESALGERLRLVAADEEETGKLTEIGGAPAFVTGLSADALEDAAIVLLAGTTEAARKAVGVSPDAIFIDLTGALEDEVAARVRAPLAEDPDFNPNSSSILVVAHPAATAIALLLRHLHGTHPIRRSVVQVFEPASERGKAGIGELQQQTINMLSFRPMPKEVFGLQLGFAMISKLGEDAIPQLSSIEERIEKHLATLLNRTESEGAGAVPMPSLRVIQAPVFHGYSISLWIEFEECPSVSDVEEALTAEGIEVRGEGVEPPDNIGIAGQSGIAVGSISADRNNGDAVWIWMVADNLRLSAENARRLVQEL